MVDRQADYNLEAARSAQQQDEERQANARILLSSLRDGLDSDEQRLFDLMYDQHTIKEIAEGLGITEAAAESRKRRLCEKIQKKVSLPDGKGPFRATKIIE